MTIEKIGNLPNWDSIEEAYIIVVKNYQKNRFKTDELAQAKLGTEASRSAVEAESTSLYNVLRLASMYGLAVWHGGNEFSLKVIPDDSEDAWSAIFVDRAKLVRNKIIKRIEEAKKAPQLTEEVETKELDGKKYLISYIGADTTSDAVDSFVLSIWDPKEHEGVVLCAWGRNIKNAKYIAEELLNAKADVTFKYIDVDEDIYKDERGYLCGDVYLKVSIV